MGGYFLGGAIPRPELIIIPTWEKILILTLIVLLGSYLIVLSLFGAIKNLLGVGASLIWFIPVFISPILVVSCLSRRKKFFKGVDMSWISYSLWGWVVNWLKINFYFSSIFRSLFIRGMVFVFIFSLIF